MSHDLISSRNVQILQYIYRLAKLHYKQGSEHLARTLAQKPISLGAEGRPSRQAKNLLE